MKIAFILLLCVVCASARVVYEYAHDNQAFLFHSDSKLTDAATVFIGELEKATKGIECTSTRWMCMISHDEDHTTIGDESCVDIVRVTNNNIFRFEKSPCQNETVAHIFAGMALALLPVNITCLSLHWQCEIATDPFSLSQ